MYTGVIGVISWVVAVLWWIAPFTFVFFFISAIKKTIQDDVDSYLHAFWAAFSLLVVIAAIVLR